MSCSSSSSSSFFFFYFLDASPSFNYLLTFKVYLCFFVKPSYDLLFLLIDRYYYCIWYVKAKEYFGKKNQEATKEK